MKYNGHNLMNVRKIIEIYFFNTSSAYLIESPHSCTGRRNHIINKEEESVLWSQVNSLSDEEVELSHCEIWRHQVFFLI